MNSKNIWYISKYAGTPKKGGPVRQYLFSKHFALRGYQVVLISSNSNGFEHLDFKGNYKLINNNNFKHYILKGSKIDLGFNFKRIITWFLFEYRLLKFLKNQSIHQGDTVIVSSLSILTFLSGAYLKRKHGVRFIVEVRDIWPLTLVEFKNLNKKNPIILLLSKIERLGYIKADAIVGSMANLGEHIKDVAFGNEKKFYYIPMGLDNSVLGETKNSNLGIHKDFIVGYAGSIGNANKVDLILESAEILRDNQNIKFKILGDGSLKEYFLNKYKKISNVDFLPSVSKKRVGEFLSACDILVNPWEDHKIYRYGISPNKWIDYMYAAKPIIVPFNGYKNIINEAKCGEFIDTDNPRLFADTILRYSKMSNEELDRIGLNGRRYLEKNLTYNILADKYLEIINR